MAQVTADSVGGQPLDSRRHHVVGQGTPPEQVLPPRTHPEGGS